MTQKYYKIEFIPDAKNRYGSIHAVELWTKFQLFDYATTMVRNDLNSNKINFELVEVEKNSNDYSNEAVHYDVFDTNTKKYLGHVTASII